MEKINPPELEQEIGLLCYKSRTDGIGGKIKQLPEDFIVEEITEDGAVLEAVGYGDVLEVDKNLNESNSQAGEFIHFTLQKNNWDTMRAMKEISKRLGVSRNRLSFAGTKDKRAVTVQRASAWNIKEEDLEKVNIKDIQLREFSYSNDRIDLGDLQGNRFAITIRNLDLDADSIKNIIDSTTDELKAGFPNFFGVQRFGTTRPITHLVGKEILKGNPKEAAMLYLTKTYPDEPEETREAREFLRKTEDFKESIKKFPRNLGYELSMLNHLIQNPDDFPGALKSLPKKLGMMFVHAYQSYIFNLALSRYITEGFDIERLPLPGHETELDEITEEILSTEKISREDFRIKGMREFSSKGMYRECFIPFENFRIMDIEEDDLNEGSRKATIVFSLGKGSYATTLLREFMKNSYWS